MTLRHTARALPAVLGLAACPGNGDGNTKAFNTWDGEERYLYGYSASAEDLSCDMLWVATGVPSSKVGCRECLFTFDVTLTYDATRSSEDGTCTELAIDTTFTYAFQPSSGIDRYAGAGPQTGAIGTFYSGYFVELGQASFDASTGSFSYRWGETDNLYYDGNYGYYTDLHVGTATVQ